MILWDTYNITSPRLFGGDNDIDRVYRIETGTSDNKIGDKISSNFRVPDSQATSPAATWALKHMALKNGDTSTLVIFMAMLALLLKKKMFNCSTIINHQIWMFSQNCQKKNTSTQPVCWSPT